MTTLTLQLEQLINKKKNYKKKLEKKKKQDKRIKELEDIVSLRKI